MVLILTPAKLNSENDFSDLFFYIQIIDKAPL